MALRHGIEVIYHANYADERALDALEAARDRVFVGPALGITYNLSQAGGQWGVTAGARPGLRARAGGLGRGGRPHAQARHPRAARRRLRLPVTPHGTYARDLWLFVKILGFSPMETLVAATRLGGELMGHARRARRREGRARSPICCWWTAIRSPTSRSCRTAARCA